MNLQLEGMNKSFLARSLHKWIGLFVGLQVLIWLATGPDLAGYRPVHGCA